MTPSRGLRAWTRRTGTVAVIATAGVLANLTGASAVAAGRGELAQLPSPMDCIEQNNGGGECGTLTGQGLTGAHSLVVSPDGHNIYVIGSGIYGGQFQTSVGQLAEFQRNPDGSVTQLAPPNACTPTAGPECSGTVPGFGTLPRAIAISPDGKNVYVTEQRNNSIVEFTRDPVTGILTALGCLAPHGGRVASCSNTAYGLSGPQEIVVSPDGRNVYVAASNRESVAEFARSPLDGSLLQLPGINACIGEVGATDCLGNQVAKGLRSPRSIVVSPDGANVYVSNASYPGMIAEFSRSPIDGSLTQPASPNDCVSGSPSSGECATATATGIDNARALVISRDNRNLYVAGQSNVAEFSRNVATGSIAQLPSPNDCFEQTGGSAPCGTATGSGLRNVFSLGISPDGTNLYAGGGVSYGGSAGTVATLLRNPTDGSLSQLPAPNDCIVELGGTGCGNTTGTGLFNGVEGVAVSPDGANVYSAAFVISEGNFDGALAAFSRSGPPATVTVREASTPASDAGRFDLKVNSTVVRAGAGNGDSGGTPEQPGSYTVSETASMGSLSDYTTTISCTKNGNPDTSSSSTSVTITVAFGDSEDCTIHNTHKAAAATQAAHVKHPVLGQWILLTPIGGVVYVQLPGPPRHRWWRLTDPELVPPGTKVNARYGEVEVTSATDPQGDTQSAVFSAGAFILTQLVGPQATLSRSAGPQGATALVAPTQVTVLTLIGAIRCPKPSEEAHGARRSAPRSLWGSGHGTFRTVGKVSAATVRGTIWLTVDECDATLTRVFRGVVSVRDFAHHRTVSVPAGHSYRAIAR